MVAAAWAQEHGAEKLEESSAAHRRFAQAQEDDRRQTYLGTDAIERQAMAREAEAEAAETQAAAAQRAAEMQAAAAAKVAEARRQAAAELGDEFTEALGDGDSAASEIEKVTARLEELYKATGRVVTVAASSEEQHIKAALAMYDAEDAAGRLAEAQQRLAENTDPEAQRALEVAVLRAQQGFWRAQEGATELNAALTEGSSWVTNYAGEIGQLEARLEELQGEAMVESLYQAADAAGASASTLALLAAATGDYTDAQIGAALKTAALQEKIEGMGAAIATGDTSVQAAIEELRTFSDALDEVPDETVVNIGVTVADIEADIDKAADRAAQRFAERMSGGRRDGRMTIKPQADTSEADTALDITAGKADAVTEAVEEIPDVVIDTEDATQALEDTTTEAENLLSAIEDIPSEVSVTVYSNLSSEISKAERLRRLLLDMPDSPAAPTWTGYDDDPTSLH